MFGIDQRLRGLPASREQVMSVYQSINQPHLAVPGKQAGPAQAYIVGLRGSSGISVFVYLFLAQTLDCAVYVPERRNVPPDAWAEAEADALGFVESMGFMMDNLNFRSLPVADQDALLRSLPVFQKDPRLAQSPGAEHREAQAGGAQNPLARLLGAF